MLRCRSFLLAVAFATATRAFVTPPTCQRHHVFSPSTSSSSTALRLPKKGTTGGLFDASSIPLEQSQQQDWNTLQQEEVHDDKTSVLPSYRQLLLFFATTTLIWLSEPLLSLVDTTVVGWAPQNGAILQLASLGPATTLYDSLLYLTYFLAIATTNKLAPDIALRRYRSLQQTTSHVLGVSLVLGAATTVVVMLFGKQLLSMILGGGSGGTVAAKDTAALLFYASRYIWIRGSICIASIMGMVMQSFCLATLNTKTPAQAVLVASVVNVVGDIALRPWGVQGAALATAVSSLLSSFILFGAVRKQMKEWRKKEKQEYVLALQDSDDSSVVEDALLSNTTMSLEHQSESKEEAAFVVPERVPLLSLPDRKSFIDLVKLSGPIFFVILAKIACYGAMTVRTTEFGVVPLAAENIMMRVFFIFGTFGDALSQAAQSYLPASLYPKVRQKSFRKLFKRLLVLAGVVGVTNSRVSVLILKRLGRFLANDSNIVQLMASNTLFLGLAILVHPFILIFEGAVIASRDFRTLVTTYLVTLGVHFSILNFFTNTFPGIWRTFFLFQSIRVVNFGYHVWKKQADIRRQEAQDAAA